jgi:hypothetical protein
MITLKSEVNLKQRLPFGLFDLHSGLFLSLPRFRLSVKIFPTPAFSLVTMTGRFDMQPSRLHPFRREHWKTWNRFSKAR